MTKHIIAQVCIGSHWYYVGDEITEGFAGKYDNPCQAKLFNSISDMMAYLSNNFEKGTIFKTTEVWKL